MTHSYLNIFWQIIILMAKSTKEWMKWVKRFGAALTARTSPITASMTLRNMWSLNMSSIRVYFVLIVTKPVQTFTLWGNTSREITGMSFSWIRQLFPMIFSALIKSKMQKESDGLGGFLWRCLDCGHTSKRTTDLTKHIEAKHISACYDCSYCGKHCPSKNALTSHVSRQHRNTSY